jgi:hypothetical protein
LGGGDAERATSIALAPDGSVVVGGKTATYPFYGAGSAFQSSVGFFHASDLEIGFVAKLAADGSRWMFVAPLGSSGGNLQRLPDDSEPSPIKVAVDASGAIYATGHTSADRALPVGTENEFGTISAIQSPAYYDDGSATVVYGPDWVLRARGAFLMKLTADGSRLLYSIIVNLGRATGLALDNYGAAYVVGYQAGPPQINAAQAAPGAVFVTKVSTQTAPVILTSSQNPATAAQSITLSATVGDARYAGSIEFRDGAQLLATVPLGGGLATYAAPLGVGIHRMNAIFRGSGPFDAAMSAEIIQIVNQTPPGP